MRSLLHLFRFTAFFKGSVCERLLFPPCCVQTQQLTQRLDLQDSLRASLRLKQNACPICGHIQPQSLPCVECVRQPPAFERTQFAFQYHGLLKELIQEFKFKPQRSHGRLLAELSCEYFSAAGVEALLPVPLHVSRYQERGFNQAQRLAHYWGKAHSIPVLNRTLVRYKPTQPQSTLPRTERMKNVASAFQVQGNALANMSHIAIVDDVMTTGSTLRGLAQVLKKQYPNLTIETWVLARAQE